MPRRIGALIHGLVGLALLALGVRYTLASELMPYHLAVLGKEWGELAPAPQTLFLGLLRGFGAGAVCAGGVILYLALHGFRSGAARPFRVLAGVSLGYTLLLVWVTRDALLPGARPIAVSTGLLAVAALASALSLRVGSAGR